MFTTQIVMLFLFYLNLLNDETLLPAIQSFQTSTVSMKYTVLHVKISLSIGYHFFCCDIETLTCFLFVCFKGPYTISLVYYGLIVTDWH